MKKLNLLRSFLLEISATALAVMPSGIFLYKKT